MPGEVAEEVDVTRRGVVLSTQDTEATDVRIAETTEVADAVQAVAAEQPTAQPAAPAQQPVPSVVEPAVQEVSAAQVVASQVPNLPEKPTPRKRTMTSDKPIAASRSGSRSGSARDRWRSADPAPRRKPPPSAQAQAPVLESAEPATAAMEPVATQPVAPPLPEKESGTRSSRSGTRACRWSGCEEAGCTAAAREGVRTRSSRSGARACR